MYKLNKKLTVEYSKFFEQKLLIYRLKHFCKGVPAERIKQAAMFACIDAITIV